MSDSITIDCARLPLLLGELRLPTIGKLWQSFTERADREGWPSARLLATLAELELAERAQRRTQRHLLAARLPPGKTLGNFDFSSVPMISHAHVTAACRAAAVGESRRLSGNASDQAAYSACKASNSAMASRQRCGRERRSADRRQRTVGVGCCS